MIIVLGTTASSDITPEVLYFGASCVIAGLLTAIIMFLYEKNHPESIESESSGAELLAGFIFLISFIAFSIWDMLHR